jgi:hypothetical protein
VTDRDLTPAERARALQQIRARAEQWRANGTDSIAQDDALFLLDELARVTQAISEPTDDLTERIVTRSIDTADAGHGAWVTPYEVRAVLAALAGELGIGGDKG